MGVPDGGSKGWRMSRRGSAEERHYFLSNISVTSRWKAVISEEWAETPAQGLLSLCDEDWCVDAERTQRSNSACARMNTFKFIYIPPKQNHIQRGRITHVKMMQPVQKIDGGMDSCKTGWFKYFFEFCNLKLTLIFIYAGDLNDSQGLTLSPRHASNWT